MTAFVIFLLLHPLLALVYVAWARTRSQWLAAAALVLSVVLNLTTATLIWGLPREWTLSQRMKRARAGTGRRALWAAELADWLNKHDPGHV